MEYKLRQFDTEGKCGQVLSMKVFGCVGPLVFQRKVIRNSPQRELDMVVTMLVVLLPVSLLLLHHATAQSVVEAPLASLCNL